MNEIEAGETLVPSAKEMDEYFASIEDVFKASLEHRPPRRLVDSLMIPAVVAVVCSIIPIAPAIAWGLIQWRSPHSLPYLRGWAVPIHSFPTWWVLCSFVTIAFLSVIIRIDSSYQTSEAPDLLKGAAMRFALCYATGKELEKFTKNKLAKHTQLAWVYWVRLRLELQAMFSQVFWLDPRVSHFYYPDEFFEPVSPGDEDPYPTAARPLRRPKYRSFFGEILTFEAMYGWFRLSPSTLRTVNAIDSLIVKIPGRIRDKKDIRAVSSVFFGLASYLFTTIPELSEEAGSVEGGSSNEAAILSFVEAIEPLSVYFAERQPLVGKDKVKSKVVLLGAWVFGLFISENLLVKFFAWWVMGQLLAIGGVAIAFHFVQNLKPELAVPILLSTPCVVAAGALATQARGKA